MQSGSSDTETHHVESSTDTCDRPSPTGFPPPPPPPPPEEDLSWVNEVFQNIKIPPSSLPVGKLLEISEIAHTLNGQLDSLSRQRDIEFSQRDQTIYEWDSTNYKIGFVRETRESLAKELETFAGHAAPSNDVHRLQTLRKQFLDDGEAFDKQIEKLKALEVTFRQSQKDIKRKEDRVRTTSQKLLSSIEDLGLPPSYDPKTIEDSEPTLPLSNISTSRPMQDVHPTVVAYYGKIADVKVMRERLAQLISEFEEEKSNRTFYEEQGEPLLPGHDEFEASFHKDYSKATDDLSLATMAANTARKTCEVEGLSSQIDQSLLEDAFDGLVVDLATGEVGVPGYPSPLTLGPLRHPLQGLTQDDRVVSSSRLTMYTDARGDFSPTMKKTRLHESSTTEIQKWMLDVPDPSIGQPSLMAHSHPEIGALQPLQYSSISQVTTAGNQEDNDCIHLDKIPQGPTAQETRAELSSRAPPSKPRLPGRSSSESELIRLVPPTSLSVAITMWQSS